MAMEQSILISTKKILGLAQDYTPFDLDVITHINSSFSVLSQLGIGPEEGYSIDDELDVWGNFNVPEVQLHVVKSYIYLRVRLLFDPPATSYMIDSAKRQLDELEWRLNVLREYEEHPQEATG